MESHQFSQCVDNNFDLLEHVQNETLIVGSIGIERRVALDRFVLESNVESNKAAVRFELNLRIGFRNLEDAHYSSVLNIPFMYVKGGLLPHSTITYELYVDERGDSENDNGNLMLIPVRKFSQDTQEGRDFGIRMTVEGLKTEHGISYSIRNAGEFCSTPILELSGRSSDDERGHVPLVGIRAGGEASNGKNQVIQHSPQVGDTVADDLAPSFKVGADSCPPDRKPEFGALIVTLKNKLVGVFLEPCRDFVIDDFEVVARPS